MNEDEQLTKEYISSEDILDFDHGIDSTELEEAYKYLFEDE